MRVEKEIRESEQLIEWLDRKIDGLAIMSNDRNRVAVGCLDMALEHHKALVLLIANALYGTAAALVRLIFDSYVRGCWLKYCATDSQIENFKTDKLNMKLFQFINDLEKHEAFNGGTLTHVKKTSYDAMNSFTHSGFLQVVRRNTSKSIEPNYSDGELIDALETADSFSILTAIAISDLASNEKLALEVFEKGKKYFE
jgi:hypothetical protein